jgi:hypothetical protein
MAHIRRLPSGKFQATVRLPSGKRTTRTDRLRKVVADWARAEEERVARGEWRDQRSGRVNYEDWRDRWLAARVVEPETMRRDRWVIPMHLDPQWSGWRLPAITRMEVGGWVKRMQRPASGRTRSGTPTTAEHNAERGGRRGDHHRQPVPPRSTCPRRRRSCRSGSPASRWTRSRRAARSGTPRPSSSCRGADSAWGECSGLRIGRVAFLRRRLTVVGVNTQNGRWKEYPKSKSRREIPVPPHVLELLAPLADAGAGSRGVVVPDDGRSAVSYGRGRGRTGGCAGMRRSRRRRSVTRISGSPPTRRTPCATRRRHCSCRTVSRCTTCSGCWGMNPSR